MQSLIQPVVPDDAAAVRALMERTIRESVIGDANAIRDSIANVNKNLDRWLADPAGAVHLKATEGDALLGVILVKEYWNLCSLFVDPDWQGKGIGRALVEQASAQCRGRSPKGALYLNAATNAVPFYTHLGFTFRKSSQVVPEGFRPMERAL